MMTLNVILSTNLLILRANFLGVQTVLADDRNGGRLQLNALHYNDNDGDDILITNIWTENPAS